MGRKTQAASHGIRGKIGLRTLLQTGAVATVPFLVLATVAVAAESMHTGIEKYEGSATCLECHDTLGKEVGESLHYRGRGAQVNVVGGEPGTEYGFVAGSCIPGITAAGSNWLTQVSPKERGKEAVSTGCALCHAGTGGKPGEKSDAADSAGIDCLICHGPDYRRTVVKDSLQGNISGKEYSGFKVVPAPGVDSLKSAQKAQKPTAEMCLRCHTGMGGGPNFKRGTVPTADADVHFSMGMNCTECHTTKKHKIAGGADLRVQEAPDVVVTCANCHGEAPHKGTTDKQKEEAAILNRHAEKLACPSCHVPAIARDSAMPTVVEQDWSKPQLDAKTGLYQPTTKLAAGVKPEFFWWNRFVRPNGEPVGSRISHGSKVSPWKKISYTLIADEVTGKPLNLNLSSYWTTGDVGAAARKGASEAKQTYSGKWKPLQENHYFSVNHQVAPKSEAHKCEVCHNKDGLVDFKALKRQRL